MEFKIFVEIVEDNYNLIFYLGVFVDFVYERDSGDFWFVYVLI